MLRSRFRLAVLVPGLLLLSACGLFQRGGGGSFTLALNPSSLTVQQGGQAQTTLTLTPQNGFTGTVSLSLEGAPEGVSLSPASVAVSGPGPVTQTLTLSTTASTPPGSYPVQVKGSGGGHTAQAGLTLTVTASGGGGGAGMNWTLRRTGLPFTDVTYGNGLFVVVGDSGTVLTYP